MENKQMNEYDYLNRVKDIIRESEEAINTKALNFNIFRILNISDREVRMCRVLYEFLNPKGSHGRGGMYLEDFLKNVLELDDITSEEVLRTKVYRECVIKGTDRRIDIYIDTPYRAVPVEVNIYAEEQERQCLDYYEFAKEENAKKKCRREWRLAYLTLYGGMPSEKSTGGDKACIDSIKKISWCENILKWLENIGASQKENANVWEIVLQYMDEVKNLTGQRKGLVYDTMMDKGLLTGRENMKAAQVISESFAVRKTALIEELFEKIWKKAEEEVFSDGKWKAAIMDPWDNNGLIRNYYQFQKSTYPALNYFVKNISMQGDDTEYQLWLRFEIDHRPFLGFSIVKKYLNKDEKIDYTGIFEKTEIYEEAERVLSPGESKVFHRGGWYVDWFYLPTFNTEVEESIPNFKNCNDAYYDLYEEENLNDFVNKAVEGLKIMRDRIRTDI